MSRFRYGTKEIIATIMGSAAFVLVEWLEKYMISTMMIPADVYFWVQLRVVVVAAVAVFFGPVSGLLCGLGGDLLVNAMFDSFISYPEVLSLGSYGFLMGLYYGREHYDNRHFLPRDFVDFNAISIAMTLFFTMFFIPLTAFFMENIAIDESLVTGAKSAVGNSVLVGIICPILMAIVSAVHNAGHKTQVSGT